VFAAEARARIDDLTVPSTTDAEIAQSRAEEDALRLSGVRAQILELRLRDIGHDPGRLDGVIDDDTRNAIAAYQDSQGITATGYVDRATAVGLMTGALSITIPRP
jgi:peptidoglycan hydrolase-like protein with peptidoglycan-binding domain